MKEMNGGDIRDILAELKSTMRQNKDLLTELDSRMGDGDLGLTMEKAFTEAPKSLTELEDETDIGKILIKLGMGMARAAPSTMGTLFATGFMRGGKAVLGKDAIGLNEFADMFEAFVEGIMERGKSKPGEKTVLDALQPAADALRQAAKVDRTLCDAFKSAYQASADGVERTKSLIAKHGRQAYYGEKSLGQVDPGATVGMLFVKSFYEYMNKNYS